MKKQENSFFTTITSNAPEDLQQRILALQQLAQQEGYAHIMPELLTTLEDGFKTPFHVRVPELTRRLTARNKFTQNTLAAFSELSQRFENRVPACVWQSLAFLALRPDPENEVSILDSKTDLHDMFGLSWEITDACLHAVGKTYELLMCIQTIFNRHTGHIIVHGCDCNGCIRPNEDGVVDADLVKTKERIMSVSQSLMGHILAEYVLIKKLNLPFALNPKMSAS